MTPFGQARRQTFTPLLTPFSGGVVNHGAFEAAIERQIVAGIDGIVIGDVIGEGPTSSDEEREMLLKTGISNGKRHLSVIAATGTNCTAATIARCRRAEELGADALLVTVPYYSRPTLAGVVEHFRRITAAVSLPVVVDDDPGRTARDYGPALMEALAGFDIITGICHGTDRLGHFAGVSQALKDRYLHLSRDDATLLPFLSTGGAGALSAVANVIPSDLQAVVAMTKERQEPGSLVQAVATAVSAVASQDIAALKEAACFAHQFPRDVRLPLLACEPETVLRVRQAFAAFAGRKVAATVAA